MIDPLATLSTEDGRPVLRFERRLAHPPAKVWRALTDPAELAGWFPAAVELELRAGAPMRFAFDEAHVEQGRVLEVEAPRVFAFLWGAELLRWELEPDGDGCRLRFWHTMSGDGALGEALSAARHAAGWDGCLDGLAARLDGREAPFDMAAWLAANERYVEAFGLGEGTWRSAADGYEVRFARDLVQPVDEAWVALTESRDDPAVGGEPPLRFTNGYVAAGRVTAVEPPHLLEYAWLHGGEPAGHVRWELHGHDYGSRLALTQTIPAQLAELRAVALAAWQTHLELYVATLHGAERCWPAERTQRLEAMYADRIGSP
jgi:uncharacterized protein YndB with AHSA1/START domain